MLSYTRLLELAGRALMLEDLSPRQAAAILRSYGVSDASLASPALLKQTWKALMRKHHSDHGGSPGDDPDRAAKEINAAYDVLKGSGFSGGFDIPPEPSRRQSRRPTRANTADDDTDGYPAWAMAGYSGGMRDSASIYRQDYRDMNYFKKRMWELSGKSTQEWTVMAFDGAFFRSSLTVYGSPAIFKDMAEAMKVWNSEGGNPYRTRAVFVNPRRKSNPIYLIYADGQFYDKDPIPFEHDSFNANPSNDQSFVRRLPEMLDRLRDNPLARER